ncbi:MAG: hypothetical protein PHN64_06550 [Desulfovibrionaceae bacterium]|nr:hypothetical protein [Desulfovibrionaceae bacterium]
MRKETAKRIDTLPHLEENLFNNTPFENLIYEIQDITQLSRSFIQLNLLVQISSKYCGYFHYNPKGINQESIGLSLVNIGYIRKVQLQDFLTILGLVLPQPSPSPAFSKEGIMKFIAQNKNHLICDSNICRMLIGDMAKTMNTILASRTVRFRDKNIYFPQLCIQAFETLAGVTTMNKAQYDNILACYSNLMFYFPQESVPMQLFTQSNLSPWEGIFMAHIKQFTVNKNNKIDFSSNAMEILQAFHEETAPKMKKNPLFQQETKYLLKFASLFAILRNQRKEHCSVRQQDAEKAIKVMNILAQHSMYLYEEIKTQASSSYEHIILNWIREKEKGTFTASSCYRSLKGSCPVRDLLDTALTTLCSKGHISKVQSNTKTQKYIIKLA